MYDFDTQRAYKAIFNLTKQHLVTATTLKLETTNNHYSDIFKVTAKANGNKIKEDKSFGHKKQLPKAGFDGVAAFLGAM